MRGSIKSQKSINSSDAKRRAVASLPVHSDISSVTLVLPRSLSSVPRVHSLALRYWAYAASYPSA